MKKFNFESVLTLKEALGELDKKKRTVILAGGTDLMLKIKHEQLFPNTILSINKIEELNYIRFEKQVLHIGPTITINELAKNKLISEKAPLLGEIAQKIASPEVRNMATMGGNICAVNANCAVCGYPGCKGLASKANKACRFAAFSDLMLPLMALDANLTITSSNRVRLIKLENFQLKGEKNLKANEILTDISFKTGEKMSWGQANLSTAKFMGIQVIAVLALLRFKENKIAKGTLVIGGSSFERIVKIDFQDLSVNELKRNEFSENLALLVGKELKFVENLRFAPNYRQQMTPVLMKDALRRAVEVGYEKAYCS